MELPEFEELNEMSTERSVPYDTYFGEMGISQEDKENRKEMARQFEELFMLFYAMIAYEDSADFLASYISSRYLEIVRSFHPADMYIREYSKDISSKIVQTTFEHIDEPYYTSYDRARYIAENESNTVLNHYDFEDAKAAGYEFKTWETMMDERVRPDHWAAQGQTVPIDEPFEIGVSLMMYPKDYSLGADPNEVIGCRCWIVFS